MPEYLAPGVFVEEVSFRSKSIEGVATSTTGFVGLTRWGPVCYRDADIQGPINCEPRLITSFTEFERVYGGLEVIAVGAAAPGDERLPYLGHAARAFFENGGKRLYVSRVFVPRAGTGASAWGIAERVINVSDITATWTARWPGALGNVFVETQVVRSKNLISVDQDDQDNDFIILQRVKHGSVVELITGAAADSSIVVPDNTADEPEVINLRVVEVFGEGEKRLIDQNGAITPFTVADVVQLVEMKVRVTVGTERLEEYVDLAASPDQKRFIGRILEEDDPENQDAPTWLNWEPTSSNAPNPEFLPALLIAALWGNTNGRLDGGHDGDLPGPSGFAGSAADPDDPLVKATGLEALAEVDDISIVAMPDSGDLGDR